MCARKITLDFAYNSYDEYFHVVCGISDEELWLITAYRPSVEKWESDLKTRKVDS